MFRRPSLHASTIAVAAVLGFAAPARAQDSTRATPVAIHGFVLVYYRAGDPLTADGYRLRKADLKFSGDVAPDLHWRLSFDAAKSLTINRTLTEIGDSVALSDAAIDQRSRMLQDAALTWGVRQAALL